MSSVLICVAARFRRALFCAATGLLLAACAGPVGPADGLPAQDLSAPDGAQPLRTCMEVRAAYEALVGGDRQTACSRGEDCHLVSGQCGRGFGGCYHAVNHTVRQADVNALGDRYQELMCFGPVCACAPPPPVECRMMRCALKM